MKPPRGNAGGTGTRTGVLPDTIWPPIERLKQAASTERQDLYEFLIRRYWKPVYRFILCKGYGEQKTEELVLDFFAFCFQKNVFAKADPDRGRFRSFLLKSLQHFIANARRYAEETKRYPRGGFVTIHELATGERWPVQLADTKTPEDAFELAWLQELLLRALEALKQDYQNTQMTAHHEILLARVVRPIMEGSKPVSFKQLAKQHGLTEKEAANRCLTARRALMRHLKNEIRIYASSDAEETAEIKDIFQLLSG